MDRFELRRADFSLDEDQEAVFLAFADFFRKECPTTVVRAAEPLGHDPELWRRLVSLGVPAMGLPTAAGGDGATLVDLTLVAEEHGRAVAPVPLISQLAAGRLLAATATGAGFLDGVLAGGDPVALALHPVAAGQRQLVPDAAIARHVIALTGSTLAVHTAAQPAPPVANQGSTPLAWWRPGGPGTILAEGPAAVAAQARAVHEWKLLTAAALVGLTEAALRIAVEFTKTRETMGVPIGSLQGVAFPLVDVEIGIAATRNLVRRAAWLAEHEPDHQPELPAMALAFAAGVAVEGTTTAQHMQGGLGFTVEADASLFFLRAKGWSVLAGDPQLDYLGAADALVARAGG